MGYWVLSIVSFFSNHDWGNSVSLQCSNQQSHWSGTFHYEGENSLDTVKRTCIIQCWVSSEWTFRSKIHAWNKMSSASRSKTTKVPLSQVILCIWDTVCVLRNHTIICSFFKATYSLDEWNIIDYGVILLHKCHFGCTQPVLEVPSFLQPPSSCFALFWLHLLRSIKWLHLKTGFKVHNGRTELATLVAVETRLTHGEVVENRVCVSLIYVFPLKRPVAIFFRPNTFKQKTSFPLVLQNIVICFLLYIFFSL